MWVCFSKFEKRRRSRTINFFRFYLNTLYLHLDSVHRKTWISRSIENVSWTEISISFLLMGFVNVSGELTKSEVCYSAVHAHNFTESVPPKLRLLRYENVPEEWWSEKIYSHFLCLSHWIREGAKVASCDSGTTDYQQSFTDSCRGNEQFINTATQQSNDRSW